MAGEELVSGNGRIIGGSDGRRILEEESLYYFSAAESLYLVAEFTSNNSRFMIEFRKNNILQLTADHESDTNEDESNYALFLYLIIGAISLGLLLVLTFVCFKVYSYVRKEWSNDQQIKHSSTFDMEILERIDSVKNK